MHDLIGIAVSVALPWLAGACCVFALQRDAARRDLVLAAGYGYLLGALATTLAMRMLDAMAVRWTAVLIAVQLLALAAVAVGFCGWRSPATLGGRWRACRTRLEGLPPPQRLVFFACLALIVVRLCGLGLELAWRPLLPWDAWAQWTTKSRVWYEYGRLAAFVNPAQWLASGGAMQFVDTHSDYPGTVPLLQVWTAVCLGRWDESLINMPWLAILSALGFGFYAQLRRLGLAMPQSMVVSYLLLSIPFVDLHVAVAGYVDIFLAAAYGMAAMAFAHWTRTREPPDAVLALVCAIACIAIKKEGLLWALTLLPPALVAINRRVGLRVVALLGAAMLMYLLFGPREIEVLGYTLRTQFSNVSRTLFEHLFEMDNWHLLWYLTLAVIALRWRMMLSSAMAPMTILILGGFAFVFVVFFYSSAAFGVIEETLVNRLPLHMVPALAFYLAMLWREGSASAAGIQAASARAAG